MLLLRLSNSFKIDFLRLSNFFFLKVFFLELLFNSSIICKRLSLRFLYSVVLLSISLSNCSFASALFSILRTTSELLIVAFLTFLVFLTELLREVFFLIGEPALNFLFLVFLVFFVSFSLVFLLSPFFNFSIDNFEKMKGEIFNVGLSDANLSKLELCERIRSHIHNFIIMESSMATDPDQRNYIVSNKKIESIGWKPKKTLDNGIFELMKGYKMLVNSKYGNI